MKEILQKMFKFQLARNLTEKICRTLCMNENNVFFQNNLLQQSTECDKKSFTSLET